MYSVYGFDVHSDIKEEENKLVNTMKVIVTKIEKLKEENKRNNEQIEIFEHELTRLKQPIIKRRQEEANLKQQERLMNSRFNQAKLSESPLFTDMEANDECDLIEYYKDCDQDGKHFNFGDIVDTDGHRHYGYQFVGKEGVLKNSSRYDDYSWNIETGVIVPIEITRYLTDSLAKYKISKNCIVLYELPFWDKTVQKYDVPEKHLYEYRFNFDESDWNENPNGPWDLWVIPITDSKKEYKAELK